MAKWKLPFADKYVTGEFGTRSKYRIANNLGPHRGVDWAPGVDKVIPAVSAGTVRLIQWSRVLGWVMVQDAKDADGNVWYIGYCHLSCAEHGPYCKGPAQKCKTPFSSTKVGDFKKMGEPVGKIGSTGSASSGPHLHATLGKGIKSVFWGKVYDLKAFIKKQIEIEAAESPQKPKQSKPKVTTAKKAPKPSTSRTEPPKTYTVKSGDSYWKIGKNLGIDYRKLQRLNNNKPLHPGDKIKIG